MKSIRRYGEILLVGLTFFTCLGCDSQPKIETSEKKSEAAPSAIKPTENANVSGSDLGHATATANGQQPTEATNQTEVEPPAKTTQKQSSKSAAISAGASNQAPSTEPKHPQLPQPSPEQLARWKPSFTSFEPLQMLAVREGQQTGFVSFISPVNDGKSYLLGGTKLTLWDLAGTKPKHELIAAQSEEDKRLLCFAVAPKGDWSVVGDASGILRRFDNQSAKETGAQPTGANAVVQVAISPDEKEIATIPYIGEVTIWNAETLQKKTSFKLDTREVKLLQYIAPSVLIAAGETMSSWDTSKGTKIKSFPSEKYQTAVALSPDGNELVFGAVECLQRWNLRDDRANGQYWGVPFRNSKVQFSTDGSLIAVAAGDAIQILDAASGQILQVIDSSGSTISDSHWLPGTQRLLVSNDHSRTRIWGRPQKGDPDELSPSHRLIEVTRKDFGVPATVAENLAMIDLRVLPKLPNAKSQSDSFCSINYSAPVPLDEAKAFYRFVLGERGWQEATDQTTEYSIPFQKEGFKLSISTHSQTPAETLINISLLGNHDLRQTPKLEQYLKETIYEGDSSVIYKVQANLLQIETELLRKLHQAGWTAIARLNRSQRNELNTRDFEFVSGGTVLNVNVQPDRENDQQFVVSYGQSLTLNSHPVPADVGLMEWDDYLDAKIVGNTSMSLAAATSFYDEAMKRHGWVASEEGRSIGQETVYLPYFSGQRDTTIALEKLADGMVRIRAGRYSESSWQKPKDQEAGNSENGAKSVDEEATEGIEAADLPILHALGAPVYREDGGGSVMFELDKISLKELANLYREALTNFGWTAKEFGEPMEDSVSLHFEKGSKILYYQSLIDPRGKGFVTISGNGLRWNKAIASSQLITYTNWLRYKKLPASLKRLGDYQAEMEKLLNQPKAP